MNDDDDLRERLRHADPAASLPPAAPDQVRQLTEEVMSRNHTRRWALPVAAALVLLAGGTAWAMTRPAPVEVPTAIATERPDSTGRTDLTDKTVTLTANGAAAKCIEPTADRLSEISDFAFEGTVGKVENDVVTLDVTKVFRGDPATTVQVEQSADHSEANEKFAVGKSYLVAAAEGRVLICGYTGPTDGFGLRDLYEAAF
ncbi:hypothetical protein [Actinoplanes couchii]|uniref:Uncharacterized protein n=1 Tax=Actinoplanes couchii TaxID=403638 RepID=A0ABQ3X6Z4_9ACTN|nr:hypothetical protein [Actinoplanes couchii]MDR6322125.1 hypothetical protein [Actinoplanes couchii]GID54290.1 hypothetical protein Aco03nite_026940 [Actinoplanes couchii]